MKTEIVLSIAPSTRAAIRRALGQWFAQYHRDLPWRQTDDPYAIWVSEVMLQQTQVKTVVPYFKRFMAKFPTVAALAQTEDQVVLKTWEGLGYYARARNLQRAARMLMDQKDGRMPRKWEGIRQLPGIGDYIAAAILSIAFDQPYAVVDGNVKRVLARLFCVNTAVNLASGHKHYQQLAQQLLDIKAPGDHNQGLMELGALVCRPKAPLCESCPLTRYCLAFKNKLADQYPRRKKRKPIKEVPLVAGLVIKKRRILLIQRPDAGLLGGLWEFPAAPLANPHSPADTLAQHIRITAGLTVTVGQPVTTARHTYTHFKIYLQLYLCRWRAGSVRLNGPAAFRWVAPSRLMDYPLHGAMHKILPALKQIRI